MKPHLACGHHLSMHFLRLPILGQGVEPKVHPWARFGTRGFCEGAVHLFQ